MFTLTIAALVHFCFVATINSSLVPSFRVAHGVSAKENEWPSQVLIKTGESPFRICGGSIISEEWVLTAAHCVREEENGVKYNPLGYKLIFGEFERNNLNGKEVFRGISKIIRHRRYESQNHTNDIALIKMSKPLDFNSDEARHLRPICLDINGIDITNSDCYLTGFGRVSNFGDVPNTLQQLKMKSFDKQKCAKMFDDDNKVHADVGEWLKITKYQFCMVSADANTEDLTSSEISNGGACSGDSGGPLQCKHNHSYYQVGITWSTINCENSVTAFQRVKEYMIFIKKHTNYELPKYCLK